MFIYARCGQSPAKSGAEKAVASQPAALDSAALIKRGEYLVTIGGCNDCHSPKIMTAQGPAPDPQRRLSGHPAQDPVLPVTDKRMIAPGQWVLFSPDLTVAVGPWGTTFAANLTPDENTGIGAWKYEQFEKAIRQGKSKGLDGARALLPPMPLLNFAILTDADLRAMFAYLQSLPPVKNAVPNPLPPAQ